MRQPRLLHPINATIEATDKQSTVNDANAREQIQILGRTSSFVIACQVEYRDFTDYGQSSAKFDKGGFIGEESGYILVRYIDTQNLTMDAAPYVYTPQIGDKITELGTGSVRPQAMTAFVKRIKPTMHYARYGATAIKLYFADRKPAING